MPALQQLFPARFFMRPFSFDLGGGDKAFAAGGATVTVPLRKQGYLDALIVHLEATYTVATAALVFIELGAYNAVKNFLFQAPGQAIAPINAGGAFMHLWNLRNRDYAVLRQAWRVPAQGVLDAAGTWAGLVDTFPTSIAAHTLHLWWVLPFHLSVEDVRGTVALGNTSQANLIVAPAPLADFLDVPANIGTPAFTLDVEQRWLTPPPPGAPIAPTTTQPNPDGVDTQWIVAYDETYQPVVANGLQKIEILPEYTILGIAHALTLATAGTGAQLDLADITGIQLWLNTQPLFPEGPQGLPNFLFEQTYRNDVPLPDGFLMHDRDVNGRAEWIYTDSLTDIRSELTIAAGAVAGASPRIYTSVRRLVDGNVAAHLLA